ncbi:MAG: helix-turn-helix domain-containing protein [Egibacteraceae bacterium]
MTVAEEIDAGFLTAAREAVARGEALRLALPNGAVETLHGDAAQAVLAFLAGVEPDTEADLPEVLTTGQAADVLGVSRPTVVKLVDDGVIPAQRVGSHRRLRREEVFAYRTRTARARGAALDEVTHLSEELGLYE